MTLRSGKPALTSSEVSRRGGSGGGNGSADMVERRGGGGGGGTVPRLEVACASCADCRIAFGVEWCCWSAVGFFGTGGLRRLGGFSGREGGVLLRMLNVDVLEFEEQVDASFL